MGVRSCEISAFYRRFDNGAQHFHLSAGFLLPPDIEKVVDFTADQYGAGQGGNEKVRHVIAFPGKIGGKLFGVDGVFVFHGTPPQGDGTAGGGGDETVFQSVDPGGHGAAAGASGEHDPGRIDFRHFTEQIDSTQCIPCPPCGKVFAEKKQLFADGVVGAAEIILIFHEVLEPFTLTHRIKTEHGNAVCGSPHIERNTVGTGFGILIVPAQMENGGDRSCHIRRQIQIGGDIIAGETFKDDVLLGIVFVRVTSCDLGIQRRTVELFKIEDLSDPFFCKPGVLKNGFRGFQSVDTRLTFLVKTAELTDEIFIDGIPEIVVHFYLTLIFTFFLRPVFTWVTQSCQLPLAPLKGICR